MTPWTKEHFLAYVKIWASPQFSAQHSLSRYNEVKRFDPELATLLVQLEASEDAIIAHCRKKLERAK